MDMDSERENHLSSPLSLSVRVGKYYWLVENNFLYIIKTKIIFGDDVEDCRGRTRNQKFELIFR